MLSFTFGLMVSDLFAHLMCVVQLNSYPSHIGYVGAAVLAVLYSPVLSQCACLRMLVEAIDWSTASLFMVAAPPLIAFVLMRLYDHSIIRNGCVRKETFRETSC
jgi:hypothetical protein